MQHLTSAKALRLLLVQTLTAARMLAAHLPQRTTTLVASPTADLSAITPAPLSHSNELRQEANSLCGYFYNDDTRELASCSGWPTQTAKMPQPNRLHAHMAYHVSPLQSTLSLLAIALHRAPYQSLKYTTTAHGRRMPDVHLVNYAGQYNSLS